MMAEHNVFGKPIAGELANKSRVFISHRLADKPVARGVARYFEFLGLHYYFDEEDAVLQKAVKEGHSDARAIVESIDDGLAHSTHLLGVLSTQTMGSWWVPYEIGSSRARSSGIAFLVLPSITSKMLPEYTQICPNLWKPEELFDWATQLARSPWPSHVVHRLYSEWLEVEGPGPFGELGPGEDLVHSWYAEAEAENAEYQNRLQRLLEEHE